MSELDLLQIRRTLEDERDSLLSALKGQDAEEASDDNPDEMDLADLSAEEEIRLSLDQISEGVLERIERALGRLEVGTFGKCLGCGKDIPDERLLALPYADLCVSCQSQQENRQKQMPVQ